ncbi:MAG TPA: DUF983 domain-containing protein [Actinomycetota bacterium]|nr:DUF983 domain-containing protein [Actinomycetota bacterium]
MSRTTGPYDGLEPELPRPPAAPTDEPGALRAFLRGLTRRCPRCGSGGLFAAWFTIRGRCPRCRLRLQREEGGFLGAMTINYVVTAGIWLVVLVAWLIVDLPDVHVAALTIASLAIAALVPLLFFPFAKTIWAAVDYLVYRSSPEYARDAAERAQGNGGRF